MNTRPKVKDGRMGFELLKPGRKRLNAAIEELASMSEFTRLKDKADVAIAAIKELLAEFEPDDAP